MVSNKEYFIDLLFYHLDLRCYVVVELKAREFLPIDVGQLNFYLSAVDDILRKKGDIESVFSQLTNMNKLNKISCFNAYDHFADVGKMINIKAGTQFLPLCNLNEFVIKTKI